MTIGVLALQGAFHQHAKKIEALGAKAIEVRHALDLQMCNGLILPGGESTCMTRQLAFSKLDDAIRTFAKKKPVLGTCAGLILMSQGFPLQLLQVKVQRNAYGRQAESFKAKVAVFSQWVDAVFIRAPKIEAVDSEVEVLASHGNEPILVKQGNHLGATFHPEWTSSSLIHQYFLDLCA